MAFANLRQTHDPGHSPPRRIQFIPSFVPSFPSRFQPEPSTEDAWKTEDTFAWLFNMATQEEIRAKVAPDATKCLAFLRNLARDPQGVPVQIQVAWDREADAPEITALEHVWWFDYEWLDSPVETE